MRQTGRTFRTVLSAALALSNGTDTIIVCPTGVMAEATIRKVKEVLNTFGIMDHGLLTHTKRTITFMDTKLKAVSLHDMNSPAFKGIRGVEVIQDEY